MRSGATVLHWALNRNDGNLVDLIGPEEQHAGRADVADNAVSGGALDIAQKNVHFSFRMAIETLGEAYSLGWRVIVRCSHSREDGAHSKSSRECINRKELDMETLVWT